MSRHISAAHARLNGVIDPALVQIETLSDGTEVLSFPVKALREQILECMTCLPGGEFVSGTEIKKSISEWAGMPLTIDHPRNERGVLEYANRDAQFLEAVKVGEIGDPQWRDGFLWVTARLNRTLATRSTEGRGIVRALLNGSADVEVSTGYGAELRPMDGEFEGAKFDYEQVGIEPDHLALLPIGTVGACSVEMGCGAARAAQAMQQPEQADNATENAVSGIKRLAQAILEVIEGGSSEATETFALNSEAEGNDDTPGDGGTRKPTEEEAVDRDDLIHALVGAASLPFDAEELGAMDDEKLTSLATLAGVCGCADEPTANAEEADEIVEPEAAPEEIQMVAVTPQHVDFLDALMRGEHPLIDAANAAQAAADAERDELVVELLANEAVALSEQDMKGLSLSTLRGLSKSFKAVDYSGLGGPRSNALGIGEDDGYMPLPSHDAIPA